MKRLLEQVSILSRRGTNNAEPLFCMSAVMVSLVVFSAVFRDEAGTAVEVWSRSPTFNYCFLVLPMSFFLIWFRRHEIQGVAWSPDIRAAFFVFVFSLLWFLAFAAGLLEARQFLVIAMVQASLFGCMGRTLYGRLLLPLLYLFFLVPSGTFLIPALQDFTARFAVSGLHVLNIPVFSSGAVIEIPAGTFAVAEACAGVRFLITSVAFGVFYSALTYRSYTRRIVFMVLSIVVPLIANGLRVLGLLAAAEWVGSPTAVLADHIIYGWVFFSFVLLTLILIGRTFSDQIPEPASPATKTWASFLSNLDTRRTAFAAVACCAAAVCGPIAAAFASDVRPMTLPDAGPQVSAPWFKATGETDWTPKVVGPSRTFADTFEDGRNRIDRFVAVYALQKGDQTLIHSDNRAADERMWSFNSRSDANLSVDGQTFQLQGSTWLRGTQQREVWSFYVVDGVPVSSLWAAKWHQIYGRLSASRCLTGYVALSVESTAGVPSQVPIQEFLNDSQRLRTYFCPS